MPLSPGLARWLVGLGHDAVHATEIGLSSAPDSIILARAGDERRTVVTADLDYPRLLAIAGTSGPSLVLFRGGNWSDAEVLAKMDSLLASIGEQEIEQSILVIEPERVRRRKLPIK